MKTFLEKHKLLKHPLAEVTLWQLVGYIIFILGFGLVATIAGIVAEELGASADTISIVENTAVILCGLLMMHFFVRRYRPCFKGFGWLENCRQKDVVIFILAFIGIDVVLCVIDLNILGRILVPSLSTVVSALEPGIVEEILDRLLPLAAAMYVFKDRKSAAAPLILTAVLFGVTHIPNLLEGADLGMTILQIFSAAAGGVFMGAMYLRTGSFLPGMLIHTFHDFIAFLMNAPGVLTGTVTTWDIIEVVLLAAVHLTMSYFLMRGKSEKIRTVWNKIWVEEKTETA